MYKMKKESFISSINLLQTLLENDEKFNKIMEKAGFRYSFENSLSQAIYTYLEKTVNSLHKELGLADDDDTLNWYIWETDFGKNDNNEITVDGVAYRVKTVEDLWRFLNNG
jgi:ribosome assembly protein YihI (activator of Der GTPase)